MNLGGGSSDGTNAGGIFVQFNQDCTSLVAGSSSGYHLYALTAEDGVEHLYSSNSGQEVRLVDRLFSSSLVALVTHQAPRKLIVCHYKKGTEICNYSYSNTILAVKLNRSRLVVCLEESLHIHNIRDMKILHTIRETPANPRGLLALAPSGDRCLLAYPGSAATGEVQVFDCVHLTAVCVLPAHDSPLAALAWSHDGRKLATASERGTVIRVFAVPDRQRLFEFRRGVKRCVSIACLAFSACGSLLAATSNTETVHVFKLDDDTASSDSTSIASEESAETPSGGQCGAGSGAGAGGAGAGAGGAAAGAGGWMTWLSSAVSAGATLLPAPVAGVLAQGRAVAAARLPPQPLRPVAAITTMGKNRRLVVATGTGSVMVFGLEAEGGECPLLRAHSLLDTRDTVATTQAVTAAAAAAPSYAGRLRGRDPGAMTDSEREGELGLALEGSPPRGVFDVRDPRQFPAMPAPQAH